MKLTIDIFIIKIMIEQLGKEIGRGGYGIVYEHKTNLKLCVKKSMKKSNCRIWSNEYAKIKNINNNVKYLKHVKVIIPIEFYESDNECYMIMPRIRNPLNIEKTLHPLLGEKNFKHVDKKRGMFMGLNQLMENFHFNQKYLNQIAYELGMTMSNIHFKAKNDAYDVEIYLDSDYTLYLADFDLSEEILIYDQETIKRMVWSLDAIPYFPTIDCCKDLYEIFKNGYFKNLTNEERVIAILVFDLY
jgi:serine/threonine protein kinase